jgi:hypothetical protein
VLFILHHQELGCLVLPGHLSTEDEERSERPTQVTIPENVDAIHSIILDDRRISAKKKESRDPGDILRKSKLY